MTRNQFSPWMFLLLIAGLLGACRPVDPALNVQTEAPVTLQAPETAAPITAAPLDEGPLPPALRVPEYTPDPDPGTQPVGITEVGLTLTIPGDWVIVPLPDTPIGKEYALAPQPLISFAESHIVVVDLSQVEAGQALSWLCGPEPGAPETVQLESGLEVQHSVCWENHPGVPRTDWFYTEHDGKLVLLSLNDPLTREPLMEWINTWQFEK